MGFFDADRPALAAWLRLTSLPGIGTAGQRVLLKAFGTPEAVFDAPPQALASAIGPELASVVGQHCTTETVGSALDWAAQADNHLVPLGDAAYPAALLDLPDPPNLLYCKGSLARLAEPALAIVGSRNPTAGGVKNGEFFARALTESGYTIVSGLALGVDSAAHRGALASSRRHATIAVIGTGIDRVYPARNQALAHGIVAAGGLIISEFPLGAGPLAHHFPRRNRIIAGLSRGVLVVEAATESGSLITARLAGEIGREVFAIPGSIHSPQSRGCHRLIREGARLVESATDVLEEIGCPQPAAKPSVVPADDARPEIGHADPVLGALGSDPLTVDEIASRCGLTAERLLAMLFELELAGQVAPLPGGRYQRIG